MTEQPVETEQQFLGNEAPAVVIQMINAGGTEELPAAPQLQHYSPNAHLRRPAWTPVDDVELAALARKCSQAAKLLAIAKAEAVRAEEALKHALDVENEAADKLHEADAALREFIRKDTGL
jgi:hypothetical protein